MAENYTILVCDDEKEITDAIEIYLTQEGYHVLKAYDGVEPMQILEEQEVNLLIIDVMMPRLDGIRATLKIREKNSLPIIILSAKSEDADKILGLNIGADDYLVKPFAFEELLARIRVLIRKNSVSKSNMISVADLNVDIANRTVTRNGKNIVGRCEERKNMILFILRRQGCIPQELEKKIKKKT